MDFSESTSSRHEEPLVYTERLVFDAQDSHRGPIHTANFNSSGTLLATGGDDNSIRIWSCVEGKLKFHIVGHAPALVLRWTADPHVLIAGFEDNLLVTIVISYVRNDLTVYGVSQAADSGFTFPIEFIALGDDSLRLAVGGLDNVQLWHARAGHQYEWEKRDTLGPPSTYARNEQKPILITGLEWFQPSKLLVAYMHHGVVCWDTDNHNSLFAIPVPTLM
ncbi:WD40-repeat-containing domain protein [Flammula alnicola]|nr:WD40-repeat-containing domain protein [Flammula alnicola]